MKHSGLGRRSPSFTKEGAIRATEISIHFKGAPGVLFGALPGAMGAGNVLVIRIQPDEGISLRMNSKLPGAALRMEPVKMDFHYEYAAGSWGPKEADELLAATGQTWRRL